MKTINPFSNISTDVPSPLDQRYPPSKTFKRTIVQLWDGLHYFSQLPDGKTTTHTFIPHADLIALVEKLEPNFKKPPVDKSPQKA